MLRILRAYAVSTRAQPDSNAFEHGSLQHSASVCLISSQPLRPLLEMDGLV